MRKSATSEDLSAMNAPSLPRAKEAARAHPKVRAALEDKEVKRLIYVPGRIINVVAK